MKLLGDLSLCLLIIFSWGMFFYALCNPHMDKFKDEKNSVDPENIPPDLRKIGWAIGWKRAKHDKIFLGHFNNVYPENSPEFEGYRSFMNAVIPIA